MPGEQISIESLNQIEMRAAVRSLIPTANVCHCVEKGAGSKRRDGLQGCLPSISLIYYFLAGDYSCLVQSNTKTSYRVSPPPSQPSLMNGVLNSSRLLEKFNKSHKDWVQWCVDAK
jgi:hypothetical protein